MRGSRAIGVSTGKISRGRNRAARLLVGRQQIGVRKDDAFLLERGLQDFVPATVEVAHLFARDAVDRL